MKLVRWLGLFSLLSLLAIGTGWAGGKRNNSCNYTVGYGTGPVYPRPFMGAPGFGYAPWAPVPVIATRTVVYQTRPVAVDNAAGVLARAQLRLAKLGYYDGSIDGDFGPRTAKALRIYQADNGLPITGRLDRRTQISLGV